MKPATWVAVVAIGLAVAPVFGQGGTVVRSKQVVDSKQAADKLKVELAQQLKLSVMGRVTKGAPYSADTTNESVQSLADGNRIVNRTATKVYRDSEGRTRTERVEPDGTWVVSISDPVSRTTYMLYPQTRTAYQGDAIVLNWKTGEGTVSVATTPRTIVTQSAEKGGTFTYTMVSPASPEGAAVGRLAYARTDGKNVTREELGDQVIEGVTASGTRTTTIIPAGEIGNEQPIRIVSEEWLCKDLGILVMTKYSDPRSGDTTYRVTNISRVEPDPSLFQVPADYSVQPSKIKREDR